MTLVVRRLQRVMAQALPSFVELLASLDLEGVAKSQSKMGQHYALFPNSRSFPPYPPSSSPSLSSISSQSSPGRFLTSPGSDSFSAITYPSPSIIISYPSPTHECLPHGNRRKSLSNNRFSPYTANASTRRRGLPGDMSNEPDHSVEQVMSPCRASSASPSRRPSAGSVQSGDLDSQSAPHLSITGFTMSQEDQPISSLVRRRQPGSCPSSPESSYASRRSLSPNPLSPVIIPSLPPLPRILTETSHPPHFMP
ncbi:hypothetical protein BU17DRAFT_80032 [Hysterangium stoloniferum]|nr:hypothetical protein BU17DRAFT_80032 [Hysterangium stoloniferum]